MVHHGKLIVIEGVDGSGKKTQTELLLERMTGEGHGTETRSFPQYGKKSAGLVEEYLAGKYGSADDVGPYPASLFYALDRYDASFDIRKKIEGGTHVVLDRYVDSNAGHQGGKIDNDKEREQFLRWLYDIEYRICNVPKPDCVIILHLPPEESRLRIEKRAQENGATTLDIHEANQTHLEHSSKVYRWLASYAPENHHLIECMDGDRGLTREEIHDKIWRILHPLLIKN